MIKRHLEIELKELQEGADAQYDAYRRSHEQLWSLLAKAYLWWRDASQEKGYLEALYRQREIGFRATKTNLPNFNPLIRLIWNMQALDAAERATVSQWNRALQSLHEHYAESVDDFRHNAEGKLAAYIEGQGGVVGLTTNGAEYVEDEPTKRPHRTSHTSTLTEKGKEAIARHAITELKSQKQGVGSVAVRDTVRVGGDGLLVLLARREKNGQITVLGSSNDPTQINAVAALAVKTTLTNIPPSFALLWKLSPRSNFRRTHFPCPLNSEVSGFGNAIPTKVICGGKTSTIPSIKTRTSSCVARNACLFVAKNVTFY